MLGLLVSLIASAAPALPPVSLACTEGPLSCDAAPVTLLSSQAPAPVAAAPRVYATPAVIDCRLPVVPTVLQTLVGECDGTPRDASYRMSRYPESEDRGVTMTPARQAGGHVASCNGLPPVDGHLVTSTVQPIALFALPALIDDPSATFPADRAFFLPDPARDRLDRPPRA